MASTIATPLPARARPLSLPPLAVVMVAALLLALVNPFGYRGGGGDDWHYLEAARCAVAAHGPCLPTTHWAARFPIVLPLAAALALFGEAPRVLAGVAIFYSLTAVMLYVMLVQRLLGRTEAMIAGLVLIVTPTFTLQLAALNIDSVELAWSLAALLCLQTALARDNRRWALAAGVLLGIAVMARTTSLLLVPVFLVALIAIPRLRRHAAPAAIGLAALLACDALLYGLVAGDPLREWRLALGHARIPSTQIATPLGAHESPLFNRHLIAGWDRPMGIHVHWTIDPLLNLVIDPEIAMSLIAAGGLLFVERRTAPRALWLLAGAGALDAFGLIYALAIDPTPRMFLLMLCAAAAIIGAITAPLWQRGGRLPIVAVLGLSAMFAIVTVYDGYRVSRAEPILAAWAAESPGTTAIDDTTRRAFPFSPAIARLAIVPAPGRNHLLRLSGDSCPPSADGWRPIRSAAVPDDDGMLVAALRKHHLLFVPREMPVICLFSRP